MLTVLFSVMSTNLYPILILIFIPSLEELKDLNDKAELIKSFVSKDESVSYLNLYSQGRSSIPPKILLKS